MYTSSLGFCYRNKILSSELAIGFLAYTIPAVFCFRVFISLKLMEKLKSLAKQSKKIIFFWYIS